MALKEFLETNNLTFGEAARIVGVNRSTISRVASMDYPNWQMKEVEIIDKLVSAGYQEDDSLLEQGLTLKNNTMIMTASVSAYQALASSLADPEGSLSSSLGMVIGTAERGKTYTSKWFVEQNQNAVYVLYIDGSSITQLLRDICEQVANTRPYSLGRCITVLEQSCCYQRHLVIVDEADKCPIKHLETLRGINERCNLPFLFVGEEALKSKIDQVPRLRSRIRRPIVVFEPVREVEIATYYAAATGLKLDLKTATLLSKRASGGFRTVANEARALVNIANASGLPTITEAMIKQL
ncbi:MAG: AAA family ATPase [Treponemataceae bacterium]